MRRTRCRRDERGLVLMLFAITLTFLLVLVAMAVDLGQARFSKRDQQAAADLAALDAGYYLAGKHAAGSSEPARACIAAAQATVRNIDDFPTIASSTISSKCNALPSTKALCNAASPTSVTFTAPPYVLTVRYPVPSTELDSSGFSGGGVADGSDACDRLRVSLEKTDFTRFARVIGINELETDASAVIKASAGVSTAKAPAFLILERTDCGTLGNSSNGSGNLGIIVEADGANPGVIHSDSDATTNCSGTTNDAYAIYGSPLSGGDPSVTAQPGSGGAPGIIQTRATNGRGGGTFPGGLSVAPTNGPILSRKVMDTKYNSGSSTAITDLHATARTAVVASGVPAGYTVMGCKDPVPAVANVYVDCDEFDTNVTFTGVTNVIFDEKLEVKKGAVVSFPAATSIVVREELKLSKGRFVAPAVRDFFIGDGVEIKAEGALAVNTTSESSCAGRIPPAVWTNTTRMAIFGGAPAFDASGPAAMCQTTLYLAGPTSLTAYAPQQVTSGGTCSTSLPCPRTSGNQADDAELEISATVLLHAPNQYPSSTPATQGFEDLALWAEGDDTSEIKSGGELRTTGVHFFPNGELAMRSPATGSALDAQFFARKAFLFQGTMRLKPIVNNAVTVPIAGDYGLIR